MESIPREVWSFVNNLLPRDDVVSLACACPDSAPDDVVLARFTRGGLPVCICCARACFNQTINVVEDTTMFSGDPTDTIQAVYDTLRDNDDRLWFWWHIDVLTIMTRQMLEHVHCTTVGPRECFFCANQSLAHCVVTSSRWRHHVTRYTRMWINSMRALARRDSQWITSRFDRASFYCARCGCECCSNDSRCMWYFGEETTCPWTESHCGRPETTCVFIRLIDHGLS